MKVRVFTVPLDPVSGVFDDGELVAFLAEREATLVSDHAFEVDGRPTLALVVRYREPAKPRPARGPTPRSADPRAALAPEEQRRFDALRRWRNERAKRDGRPAYVLFTNAQLAEVARLAPATAAALREVDGVGDARVRDYGEDVLAVLRSVTDADPEEAGERGE